MLGYKKPFGMSLLCQNNNSKTLSGKWGLLLFFVRNESTLDFDSVLLSVLNDLLLSRFIRMPGQTMIRFHGWPIGLTTSPVGGGASIG